MAVPDFQSLMLPALQALSDENEARLLEIRSRVAVSESLSEEDLNELLPSGVQTAFDNRVNWAVIYMERAKLLERIRRGIYRITAEGTRLIQEERTRIDLRVLRKYPEFVKWTKSGNKKDNARSNKPLSLDEFEFTPEEALQQADKQLRDALEYDVLVRVRSAEPAFLEQIVIDLLIAMGYGGGDAKRGTVTGRSGDGGIDGTIREDALGLDEVYVQAKKYSDGNSVGEPGLRDFIGAIDTAGTNKGVFVTTGEFTKAAREFLSRSPKRIVLIDGNELARLMVVHDIGVRPREVYTTKRIDEDYFSVDVS